MAPPAGGDSGVIRRSIYQNSSTLVELLIRSKEPGRPGRAAAASEPAWPAAVPVRRDGRPLSAGRLPPRPRTGRPLPGWHRPGSEGDPAPGRSQRPGSESDPAPGRSQRPAPPEGPTEAAPPATEDQFRLWTEQLSRLVQDIKKRPATAHLRPLLSRLEEAVRVAPIPPAAGGDGHLLRNRLEEIQQENEELQRKFQTLSAAMREYQQQRQQLTAAGEYSGPGCPPEAAAELPEIRRQLAKYKKYAKELKKTKENLLNTIQSMEERHAGELKSLKEEHDTQLAQVMAQFTSETEMLVSFRADAEAVQRSLAQRVRENSELQRTLAERNVEIERLAAVNQSLHQVAVRQLQQLAGCSEQLPSLSQLLSKLESPGSGGCCGGPAGDSAAATSLLQLSLDVTEPQPARPFPGPDLSLASLAGSAAPETAGPGPASDNDTNRRLFGTDPGQLAGGPGGGGSSGSQLGGGGGQPVSGGHRATVGGSERQTGHGGARGDLTLESAGQGDAAPDSGAGGDRRADRGAPGGPTVDEVRRGGQAADRSQGAEQIPLSGGRGELAPDSSDWPAAAGDQAAERAGAAELCDPHVSEEGFQRNLARLNERLSDLQQGITRASRVLTP